MQTTITRDMNTILEKNNIKTQRKHCVFVFTNLHETKEGEKECERFELGCSVRRSDAQEMIEHEHGIRQQRGRCKQQEDGHQHVGEINVFPSVKHLCGGEFVGKQHADHNGRNTDNSSNSDR
jgi:hypothetical protein